MTRVFALLVVLIGVALAVQAAELTPAIVDPAVAISTALANDSVTSVAANAATIEEQAAKLQPPSPEIAAAAKELKEAKSLADSRKAFGTLNAAIVAYMDAQKLTLDPRIHVAYCPMIRKPWLQKGTDIHNPYYGKEMLTCGRITK
jgi:hypothetical protein